MTKKDKELLLKDICARLPYYMIISVNDGKYREDVKLHPHYIFDWDAERWDAKPYLRPMSSMTEKEMKELRELCGGIVWTKDILHDEVLNIYYRHDALDWLLKHHFDTRGLIEMGLALEAPEGMYKEE